MRWDVLHNFQKHICHCTLNNLCGYVLLAHSRYINIISSPFIYLIDTREQMVYDYKTSIAIVFPNTMALKYYIKWFTQKVLVQPYYFCIQANNNKKKKRLANINAHRHDSICFWGSTEEIMKNGKRDFPTSISI